MKKHWVKKELPDETVVSQLCEHLKLERPLAILLAQRGISTVQQARDFFEPDIEKLHDPFLMKDMTLAVERLSKAIVHSSLCFYSLTQFSVQVRYIMHVC